MSPTEMAQGTPSEREEMAQATSSVKVAWSSKERALSMRPWSNAERAAWSGNASALDWELMEHVRSSQVLALSDYIWARRC